MSQWQIIVNFSIFTFSYQSFEVKDEMRKISLETIGKMKRFSTKNILDREV